MICNRMLISYALTGKMLVHSPIQALLYGPDHPAVLMKHLVRNLIQFNRHIVIEIHCEHKLV